ncbi:MAG: class I SAM-dependent methyltransferase [Gammaproteobacteria bacterium]
MKDSWQVGNPYEFYMGRWSTLVADLFVDWLSPKPRLRWLDVGCGSGALGQSVIRKSSPEVVIAIDQSNGFVRAAQERLGAGVACITGDARSLPLDDASVDMAVSGLVLNFISAPERSLSEMKRVVKSGGTIAVYIWDYAGKMEFLNHFWDVAVELNPDALGLHEKRRFANSNAEELTALFTQVGIQDVEAAPIEIVTNFADFDDYWKPFLGGQGPAPTYVSNLLEGERNELRDTLRRRVPIKEDGSIRLSARAWAVKGSS